MLPWWMTVAAHLQAMGRASEAEKDDQYTDDEVRRAAVYTREDMIMVVSLLDAVNRQLRALHIILGVLTLLVGVIAIKVVGIWW